ncbi:MAG: MBL fold metallo-hydrolase [Solirubrobacterales bacterium]
MRVTVLGKSPSWQDAGGACTGYLVEDGGTSVLVDCGNGVFAKLRGVRDYTSTDAIVVSHMHSDHFFDLIPYAFALSYAPRQQPVPIARWKGVDPPPRPKLYLPPGGLDVINRIVDAIDVPDLIENSFAVSEYDPGANLAIGPLELNFQAVPHYIPTWAIGLRDAANKRFVFGADFRPNDEIVDFAKDADLFAIESTLPRPERDGDRGHLTPSEAGEHGWRAAVKQLLLTHISDELDPLWAKSEAESTFGDSVAVAAEGSVYVL